MSKEDLQEVIREIIERNYNEYMGSSEAFLHASEEIVDLIDELF